MDRRLMEVCPGYLGSALADQRRELGDHPRAAAFVQEPSLQEPSLNVRKCVVPRGTTGLDLHRGARETTNQGSDPRR
jgi:hypothetical protein